MISISKKVEYSILFLSYLSKHEGWCSLSKVSKETGLPYRFLAQLAAELSRGKLVESKEGKSGGYKLIEGWEKNSFKDLLRIIKEDKHMVKCMNGKGCKRQGDCAIAPVWKKIEDSITKEFERIKLGDVK